MRKYLGKKISHCRMMLTGKKNLTVEPKPLLNSEKFIDHKQLFNKKLCLDRAF